MSAELKPCPFCGGVAVIVMKPMITNSYREAGVWCRKCKVHVWHRFGNSIGNDAVKEGLVEIWNRRVERSET